MRGKIIYILLFMQCAIFAQNGFISGNSIKLFNSEVSKSDSVKVSVLRFNGSKWIVSDTCIKISKYER